MGALRVSKKAKDLLLQVSQESDLGEGLRLLGDLLNMVVMEDNVTTEYSKKTGEPIKYAWKPDKWDGKVWFSSNSPCLDEGTFKRVLSENFKKGSNAVVKVGHQWVVISHIGEDACCDGETPAHLLVKKARKF
jgi:hypothetical protein